MSKTEDFKFHGFVVWKQSGTLWFSIRPDGSQVIKIQCNDPLNPSTVEIIKMLEQLASDLKTRKIIREK